jgi:hypothetical protein
MRVLWLLGYADQAQLRSQEVLALAQHVGHTPSVAYAAYFVTTLSQCRRDVVATHAQADALMALAHEQGFVSRLEDLSVKTITAVVLPHLSQCAGPPCPAGQHPTEHGLLP